MTNYYKMFPRFKEEQKLKPKMTDALFKREMMLFFGFGGRNSTVDRWLNNFNAAGLIRVVREDEGWFVYVL